LVLSADFGHWLAASNRQGFRKGQSIQNPVRDQQTKRISAVLPLIQQSLAISAVLRTIHSSCQSRVILAVTPWPVKRVRSHLQVPKPPDAGSAVTGVCSITAPQEMPFHASGEYRRGEIANASRCMMS
jgi:hypothetical protein